MRRIFVAAILVICLLQHSNGYCCFRDPLMLTPKCGCSDFESPCGGVVKCPQTVTKACGCSQPVCSNAGITTCECGQSLGPSICDCGLPACSCYRDTSNVCYVPDQPSPMCSCLKAAKSDSRCNCEDMRSFIYFPEVEYPLVATEMKPYYYGGCYSY